MTKVNDLTGQRINRWTVLKKDGHIGSKVAWLAQCSCGTQKRINGHTLTSGRSMSCGCLKAESTSQRFGIDLTGQVFGRLTVLSKNGKTSHNNQKWLCQCSCGNQTTVAAGKLKRQYKATVSCGCYQQERKEHLSLDSVGHWINGTFYAPEKDCFIYVFSMANYEELAKPGIAIDMNDRVDDEYGDLFDFINVPRIDAWLIEQAVLTETRPHSECPLKLADWKGHSELRRLAPSVLFDMACEYHEQLQELGREEFAIRYLPTTPKQREQLEAMKPQLVAP